MTVWRITILQKTIPCRWTFGKCSFEHAVVHFVVIPTYPVSQKRWRSSWSVHCLVDRNCGWGHPCMQRVTLQYPPLLPFSNVFSSWNPVLSSTPTYSNHLVVQHELKTWSKHLNFRITLLFRLSLCCHICYPNVPVTNISRVLTLCKSVFCIAKVCVNMTKGFQCQADA